MLILDKFELNQAVDLVLYPNTIIKTSFKNCKVKSYLNYDDAQALGYDPQGLHNQVVSKLPASAPTDYRDYAWLVVILANGEKTCIGEAWIDPDQITVLQTKTMKYTINNVTPELQQKILQTFTGLGISLNDVTYQ